MVRLPVTGKVQPESEVPRGSRGPPARVPVKSEVEDLREEEHGPANKRSKLSEAFLPWGSDGSTMLSQQPQYNPLNEAPLGLSLKKTDSFMELIRIHISKKSSSRSGVINGGSPEVGKKKDTKSSSSASDKLKASNFPATLVRIGSWEYVSRYEGDLVAKCYFAKRKLVWEVLDGGLKNKIEIQWSDIMALKATCPDNGPSTVHIVLARQPLFFRETNPQPRKHTLWQATSDFTGGQASIHRRHFLQVPQGGLSKHLEKLIQCDPRLYSLSRETGIVLDSPYFDSTCSVLEDQDDMKCHGFDHVKSEYGHLFPGFHDAATPSGPSSSAKTEVRDLNRTMDSALREAPLPSSVMGSQVIEENTSSKIRDLNDLNKWDQVKLPGIHPSMPVSDLVNHSGQHIEQMPPGNPGRDTLEDITQYLLSDSHSIAASDENHLMSRVNSLHSLLLKEPTAQNSPTNKRSHGVGGAEDGLNSVLCSALEKKPLFDLPTLEGGSNDAATFQQPSISRKESFGDYLLKLPQIASLPQIFSNTLEDADGKAR